MNQDEFETYLLRRRPRGDGYEPLTDDFSAQHPDDDYPPLWTYGPWWADLVVVAYVVVRTVLVFLYYDSDIVNTNVVRAMWSVASVVIISVAIFRFYEKRRWRLPKNLRP